jgi:hypothetical protein
MKPRYTAAQVAEHLRQREAFAAAWELEIGSDVEGLKITQKVPQSQYNGRTLWLSNGMVINDPAWRPDANSTQRRNRWNIGTLTTFPP